MARIVWSSPVRLVRGDGRHPRADRGHRMTRWLTAVVAALALTATGVTAATQATAAPTGTIVTGRAPSAGVGGIDYAAYLPPGYADSTKAYPTIYLLHGRGDTLAAWQRVRTDLDELIASGAIPPMVVVMPDAPWNERGSWYTDSLYTETQGGGPGRPVETAFTTDLVTHVDSTYRTVADRTARAIGGYSMGGAGALRMTLAHQEVFSAALVLSPAVYVPEPPSDSSTRDYGAYGVGDRLYDTERFAQLSYPAALAALDPELPVHLFIAVGDDEYANPDPADASHDLDLESARLYNAARRVDGVTAELRIMNGGHDWDVWQPGFREGIADLAGYLRTTPPVPWNATLVGSTADDRAGGLSVTADGATTVVVNAAAPLPDVAHRGGLDAVVQRRDPSGALLWSHVIGTAANDRAYGVVPGRGGSVIVAGYTRGDLDGQHPSGATDDGFVAAVSAAGERLWTLQLGAATAADRFYAVSSDGAGGAYLAGYTSGAVTGAPSAGDKDAVLARVDARGRLVWVRQLGGAGEDKALAVAVSADGVFVGGIAGAALPGQTHAGEGDAWVARFTPDGARTWLRQFGTTENEQVSGLAVSTSGVAAVGHTRGRLGSTALGDNDIFVRAMAPNGRVRWTTQLGTATDDRGFAVVSAGAGFRVFGTTYGRLADSVGGVDVVGVPISRSGVAGAAAQIGSVARDGADDFDEANLYATRGAAGSVWLSGVTFGAPAGAKNAGAGDVFVMRWP